MIKGINLNTILLQMRNIILDDYSINIDDFAFDGSQYTKDDDYFINELIVPYDDDIECDNKSPYVESVYILEFNNKKELNTDWIETMMEKVIKIVNDIEFTKKDDVLTEIISFTTTPTLYDELNVKRGIRINLQTRIRR